MPRKKQPTPDTPPAQPAPAADTPAPYVAAGPQPPYTTRLLIVRAVGGFLLFNADVDDHSQIDADPATTIAVAATPLDLVLKVEAWAAAVAPAPAETAAPGWPLPNPTRGPTVRSAADLPF